MDYKNFLIKLSDQLDNEGKFEEADIVDLNWKEFLNLLEEGKLDFDFTFYHGLRDPRKQYSNKGGYKLIYE